MIELWGRKNAYNVQKVVWALAELNLVYTHHDIGSTPGDLETDNFLSKNPHARIPVLLDQGEHIWESNTIVRYLAASYGQEQLWQTSALERSKAERWMDWELATLQPDFIELFWGYYRTPAEQHNLEKINYYQKRCKNHIKKLDSQLSEHLYLAGDSLSIADIACGVSLYRYLTMGLNVEKPNNLMAWYNRLSKREAFKTNIMCPYDELKGRLVF